MSESLTDDEITRRVSKVLHPLAAKIDEVLSYTAGERVPFSLVVFTPNRANYVANVERDRAIEALEELLAFWKSTAEDVVAHEVH